MRKIKTFKLFEDNEFGDDGFKSDIRHIKMIMSDISDDGIDFRVIPGERDFPDEKDNIYIKIFNIPNVNSFTWDIENHLDYFDRKYKQLIGEIGDLYKLDFIRLGSFYGERIRSYKSYEEFYKEAKELRLSFSSIDFDFSSHDGKDVF
jgi:hypothetical protein